MQRNNTTPVYNMNDLSLQTTFSPRLITVEKKGKCYTTRQRRVRHILNGLIKIFSKR